MKKLLIPAIAILWVACHNEEKTIEVEKKVESNELAELSWMEGSWKGELEGGELGESWTKLNDSTYTGISFFVMGGDTLSSETLRLSVKDGEVYYNPTVKTQNNGEEVSFKLSEKGNDHWVFSNPEHDFPQHISYSLINPDSVVAKIYGQIADSTRTEVFPMKRVK